MGCLVSKEVTNVNPSNVLVWVPNGNEGEGGSVKTEVPKRKSLEFEGIPASEGHVGALLDDVTVRGLSTNTCPTGGLPSGLNCISSTHAMDAAQINSGGESPPQSSSATSRHGPRVVHWKTEGSSSAPTSASEDLVHSSVRGRLLHPPAAHRPPQSSKPPGQRSSELAGFDATGGMPQQGEAAHTLWHNTLSPTRLQAPLPPTVSPSLSLPAIQTEANQLQQTSFHTQPPLNIQQHQQQHLPQARNQQTLWLTTLAPGSNKDSSSTYQPMNPPLPSPIAIAASPHLRPPAPDAYPVSNLHASLPVIPRWSTHSSKDLPTSSKDDSARSSNEEASPPQFRGIHNAFTNSSLSPTLVSRSSSSYPIQQDSASLSARSSCALSDVDRPKGGNGRQRKLQAMSRLGYATVPRANTMELPYTKPLTENEPEEANSYSFGANATFPQSVHHEPGLPHKTGPVASLHKSLEAMLLQDSAIAEQVHASMRGIVSLAKETNQLELGRDASGAACINQYVVVKTLGRGSFGKVKLCLNTMDGQLYAIKMVNRSFILKQLQKPSRNLRKRGPRCSIDSQKANGTRPATHNSNIMMSRAGRAAASLDLPRPVHGFHIDSTDKKSDTTGQLSHTPRPSMDDGYSMAFESMMREIAVLKKLDHPHVVKLHEVIDSPHATYMMLVMEFMEQGPVMDTKGQTGFARFPELKAAKFFRQVCLGLDYLHYNNVVHGDLKPENLLVNSEGRLKIADFGSARIMSDASTSSKVSCTPAFQPPEALTWGFTEDPIISDIWALGVCLYCFVFGQLPFTGSCVLDITNSITNDLLAFPTDQPVSSSIKDLLSRLLDKNPATRATLLEVMQHPWVTFDGVQPLPSMSTLASPPQVVHVSKDEAQTAVAQAPLVSLIRTKLKEKHVDQGSYIFREGDTANCVFMIMSGAVEIIRRLDNTSCDLNTLEGMENSFSVDLDESFALENGLELIPGGVDIKNGVLHVNRQEAQELKTRMKALLMGKQQDYVVEVKGPGQVFGEVSLDANKTVQYRYSARARTSKVVVIKLTEEAMLQGLLQKLSGDSGNVEDSDAYSILPTGESHVPGNRMLKTIIDDSAADVQGW